MDWLLVITNPDRGAPKATEQDLRELISAFRRDDLISFTLQLLGALNCDRSNRYETVNRRFIEWAGPPATDVMRQVQQLDAVALWRLVEPWQQLLLLRTALQYGGLDADLLINSPEGKERFVAVCLAANDLTMPPTPPLTGNTVDDGLIAAAAITPRLWVSNPPNINIAVARMITFLIDLPAIVEQTRQPARALIDRFEENLGVPFQQALDLTAFIAYWGLATTPEQALANPTTTLINRETWLAQTNFEVDTWRRYLERISVRLA